MIFNLIKIFIFLITFLLRFTLSKGVSPIVSFSELDSAIYGVFYFEDSPFMLAHAPDSMSVYWSEDQGVTWIKVDGIPDDAAVNIIMHPYNKVRAYILTEGKTHYFTNNRGQTWDTFETEYPPVVFSKSSSLKFNALNGDYVLFMSEKCMGLLCSEIYYYTTNNFRTLDYLIASFGCAFVHESDMYQDDSPESTVLCIVESPESDKLYFTGNVLARSEDWFADRSYASVNGRKLSGLIGVGSISKFLVSAMKYEDTDEMALYLSENSIDWKKSLFPSFTNKIKEESYTLLESKNYSIIIDLFSEGSIFSPVGDLYASDSDGSYFTKILEHTNRNLYGIVDFERIQGIDGIMLANVVDNWKDVQKSFLTDKNIKSKISFNDGRTWEFLKVLESDDCPLNNNDCTLNLHSITENMNVGKLFSTLSPGVVLGMGNTGEYLTDYDSSNLFLSEDAGRSWKQIFKGPHLWEIGDQGGIIFVVFSGGPTSEAYYSLDRGATFEKIEFGIKIKARFTNTLQDSTAAKFIIVGSEVDEEKEKELIVSIDLSKVFDRNCDSKNHEENGDFEKWYPIYDENGEPGCIMGKKQFYYRRKASAVCLVGKLFEDPIIEYESCPCTETDYECDVEFSPNKEGECTLSGNVIIPPDQCQNADSTFLGSSGYRLKPGNMCIKGDNPKDKLIEYKCDRINVPTDSVAHVIKEFPGSLDSFIYLERPKASSGNDETVLMRTTDNKLYVSHDQGNEWNDVLPDVQITHIYTNPYFKDEVYLITNTDEVYYSKSRATSFSSFKQPTESYFDDIPAMVFHPTEADSFIWTGATCENILSNDCSVISYVTTDSGRTFKKLLENSRNCDWGTGLKGCGQKDLIICEKVEGNHISLIASPHYFSKPPTILFDDIIGFAKYDGYLIVATIDEDGSSLKAKVSLDGEVFADVEFPKNFKIDHQQAYTVLDASNHAMFLHVTVNPKYGSEYGSIMKSNSNGTFYVDSIDFANRNPLGFVDFEKMYGLEGISLTNIVINPTEAVKGSKKKLKSKITFNDGGEWHFLQAPDDDSEGNSFGCDVSDFSKCSLNLHGYTERKDIRDSYSSESAVGLMIGVGSVGEYLSPYEESNTFLTRDGGVTWKEIRKGPYMWEYGDQGSIIVIVNGLDSTNKLLYSLDEGNNWNEYEFYIEPVKVNDLVTVPSDTSRKFIIFASPSQSSGSKFLAIQIDFTGLTSRKCALNPDEPDSDDFEQWTPGRPGDESNCLFGHVAQYHRKILGRNCYIGDWIPQPHKILNNCTCTRADYECDYDYYRAEDGSCQLVPGYSPPDHSKVCKMPGTVEYWKPTGYRRIPLSTCEGGKEYDKIESFPCPGKEDQYKHQKKGISGILLAFVIILPIIFSCVIGWLLYYHYFGRFGQIRLGEENDFSIISTESPWIKYPVIGLSAAFAFLSVVPTFVKYFAIYTYDKIKDIPYIIRRHRRSRYTTRSDFTRRDHSAYNTVNDDEGELLGFSDDELDDSNA